MSDLRPQRKTKIDNLLLRASATEFRFQAVDKCAAGSFRNIEGRKRKMPTELKYLAFTALLTASLWVPYNVDQAMTHGPLAAHIWSALPSKSRPQPSAKRVSPTNATLSAASK